MSIFQTCPTFFTETKENQLWVFKFNMLEESSEYSTSKVGVFKIIKITRHSKLCETQKAT